MSQPSSVQGSSSAQPGRTQTSPQQLASSAQRDVRMQRSDAHVTDSQGPATHVVPTSQVGY